MTRPTRPVPVTGAGHPLRRVRLRRGLTQVELAGLAGLAYSYISMIERGRRNLTRRDHVNALAAALRVPPAEIAPSMIAGSDEWAPAPAPACAFPPAGDDITMARHQDLAGRFIGHVISGDTCAAGAWLRRMTRDPNVEPLTAARSAHHRRARCARPECAPVRGEPGARDIRRQHRAGAG
jgi:transcriptional regulator with XRE-family HTH domain